MSHLLTAAQLVDFWTALGFAYGVPSKVYAKGYHRGQDIKRGPSVEVPSPVAGVVVARGQSQLVGGYVIIQDASGLYWGLGHVRHDWRHNVGERVAQREPLGRPAGWDDEWAWRGTAKTWTGPHVHVTTTREMRGLTDSTGPDEDPRPHITAALGVAAASVTPTPIIPTQSEEDEDMARRILFRREGRQAKVSRGQVWHLAKGDAPVEEYISRQQKETQAPWTPVGGTGEWPEDLDAVRVLVDAGLTFLIRDMPNGVAVDWDRFPRAGGIATQDGAGNWMSQVDPAKNGGKRVLFGRVAR